MFALTTNQLRFVVSLFFALLALAACGGNASTPSTPLPTPEVPRASITRHPDGTYTVAADRPMIIHLDDEADDTFGRLPANQLQPTASPESIANTPDFNVIVISGDELTRTTLFTDTPAMLVIDARSTTNVTNTNNIDLNNLGNSNAYGGSASISNAANVASGNTSIMSSTNTLPATSALTTTTNTTVGSGPIPMASASGPEIDLENCAQIGRHLNEFDEAAYLALDIDVVEIISMPQGAQRGCLYFYSSDTTVPGGYLYWNNSNAVSFIDGAQWVPGRHYRVYNTQSEARDGHYWITRLHLTDVYPIAQ